MTLSLVSLDACPENSSAVCIWRESLRCLNFTQHYLTLMVFLMEQPRDVQLMWTLWGTLDGKCQSSCMSKCTIEAIPTFSQWESERHDSNYYLKLQLLLLKMTTENTLHYTIVSCIFVFFFFNIVSGYLYFVLWQLFYILLYILFNSNST